VKVSNFFSKIKEPVLANPTLKFTGDIRATKLYPSPLPDLFKVSNWCWWAATQARGLSSDGSGDCERHREEVHV